MLGMGRSGTSMVARALQHCGFHVGRHLLPATEANPLGHFESSDVVMGDEAILAELGGSWFAPPPVAVQRAEAARLAPRVRALLDGLRAEAGPAPIAVKDPRIGVLLPVWQPVLAGRLHPALVIRHPLEVARSLLRRDGTAIADGLGAWEQHLRIVLETLEGTDVTVVPHRALLADPGLAAVLAEQLRRQLDPLLATRVSPEAAPAAVEPALHRNRLGSADDGPLTPSQRELWALLGALAPGPWRVAAAAPLSCAGRRGPRAG